MRKRIEVGVLGATGMVGQQFINQLAGHPWFELAWLAASERSEGKRYADAAPWRLETEIPEGIADRTVCPATPGVGPRLVFSALDAGVAGELERAFADAGHFVVSNARNHRMDPTVPLLVPEVNAEHLALLRVQAKLRGGKGRSSPTPTARRWSSPWPSPPCGRSASARVSSARCRRSPGPATPASPRSTSSAT